MKKVLPIILGIFLLSLASALTYNITAGDSYIVPFEFTEDFSYYLILGNTSPVDIIVTQNQSIVTIEFSKYMSGSFDITFYNKEDEPIVSSGGSSGGSSSSGFKKQYIITPIQLQNGYRRSMFAQNSFVFNLTNQHIFYIEKIEGKQVFLRIESDPIYLTLNEGDEKEISTEGTCIYDLSIKVNKITSVYAEIELKQINKEIDCTDDSVKEEIKEDIDLIEQICDITGCEDDTPTYVYVIILVILFMVLSLILWKYKSSKKEN